MLFILAGFLAAAVSWIANRAFLSKIGVQAIIVVSPFIEEMSKTGAAILLGSNIIFTHGIFGLIEGLYDAWGGGIKELYAGAASIIGHLFYGYVTYQVFLGYKVFIFAVFAGLAVHTLWNLTVMKYIVIRRRKAR